jgi:transposase-like protein
MLKENARVRTAAKQYGVPLWMLADVLGISEASMTRMLRRELPEVKQEELINKIKEIALRLH